MLVLKLLGVVALLLIAAGAVYAFDARCESRFSHRFFTLESFCVTFFAVALLMGGHTWREASARSGGDVLNGIVLMALGALLVLGLLYVNLRRTSLPYALFGSLLQVSIFGALALIGVIALVVGLAASIFATVMSPGGQSERVAWRRTVD